MEASCTNGCLGKQSLPHLKRAKKYVNLQVIDVVRGSATLEDVTQVKHAVSC